MAKRKYYRFWAVAGLLLGILFAQASALAVPPVVKVVPWNPGNVLVPHDTYSGKSITLKGTTDVSGGAWVYYWDFGDGVVTGNTAVSDSYALEGRHTYTAPDGTIFTATLTVYNTGTPSDTASKNYFVIVRNKTLNVEANIAIDEGLWYLHKSMTRTTCSSLPCGNWTSGRYGSYSNSGYYAVSAANVNALLVNGHREDGSADNPYVETVQRGVRFLFTTLASTAVSTSIAMPGVGTVSADANNSNGQGIFLNQTYPPYQGGPIMDAIVATGTPTKLVDVAPFTGRTYASVIGDMVDWYLNAAYRSSGTAGGWRYNAGDFPDNSAAQWGAIGLHAAQDFGIVVVPDWIKTVNRDNWTIYSQCADGHFGYTGCDSGAWGIYATTPSGMVQLALDGVGRNNCTTPSRWDKAETFMRDRFANSGGATAAVKDYYYGMFALTKSMLLHDPDAIGLPGHGVANPIQKMRSCTAGVPDIDWYAAETANGDPTDGVARTIIGDQSAYGAGGGYWRAHNYSSEQYPFETAWAIMMLNRQLFAAGSPVAVAKANPNPAVAFQSIQLDGSGSFHQDPTKFIAKWEWDTNNDGVYDLTGVTATVHFDAVGNYNVRLRVTDNGGSTAQTGESVLVVRITTPPIAPTADAGGPYNFCLVPGRSFFLDGSKSSNPDDGLSEPGKPADFIKLFSWDLDGNGTFIDASGVTPDVTAWFNAKGPGSYLTQLKVTDNTAASFPSSGLGDLSSTASGQVFVRQASDPACTCNTLTAFGKARSYLLTWTASAGADHYNVYRSSVLGGPYALVGSVPGSQLSFNQVGVAPGIYYFVVRPAQINNTENCQSNEAVTTVKSR
jgi:hypothetical protein